MKLSVITVVYNGGKTIERTIESVIGQKDVEIDYIIVDGNSTDHTMDVVKKYGEYISYMVSEPDEGIYDAMNKGIGLVSGDIIAFLNSDDWYEKDMLRFVINAFERDSEIDILCADARIVNEYGSQIRKAELNRRMLFRQLPTSHQAIFATKEWFQKIGKFNTKYLVSADFEWVTRSIRSGARIELLPIPVVNFSSGGFSTQRAELCYKEIKEIAFQYYGNTSVESDMKRYYEYREFIRSDGEKVWENENFFIERIQSYIPEGRDIYIFGAGKVGTECCKMLESFGYTVTGFVDNHIALDEEEYMAKRLLLPEDVKAEESYVIIASSRYESDMGMQLERLGLYKGKDFCLYTDLREKLLYG
jgi:Predicted glycosyltransferases